MKKEVPASVRRKLLECSKLVDEAGRKGMLLDKGWRAVKLERVGNKLRLPPEDDMSEKRRFNYINPPDGRNGYVQVKIDLWNAQRCEIQADILRILERYAKWNGIAKLVIAGYIVVLEDEYENEMEVPEKIQGLVDQLGELNKVRGFAGTWTEKGWWISE